MTTSGFNNLPLIAAALPANATAAAQKTAESIAEMARALAPVKSGRLRDSIIVETEADGATVSTDVPYSVFQEFGTSHVPAHPFMTPAAEAERSNFIDNVAAVIIHE